MSVKGDDAEMGQDSTPQIPGTPVPGPSSPQIPGTPVPGPSPQAPPAPNTPATSSQTGGFWDKLISPFNDPTFGTVAAGTGAGSGGKFSIDAEQMQAELPKWEKLKQDLMDDYHEGQWMAQVERPGGDKDSISSPYITNANLAGTAFLQHNRQMQAFVQSYIDKMKTALGQHVQTEQDNVDNLNRQQGDM